MLDHVTNIFYVYVCIYIYIKHVCVCVCVCSFKAFYSFTIDKIKDYYATQAF